MLPGIIEHVWIQYIRISDEIRKESVILRNKQKKNLLDKKEDFVFKEWSYQCMMDYGTFIAV